MIPSDDKWSSRYIVANALVDQISHLPLAYPLVTKDKKKELKDALKELKKNSYPIFYEIGGGLYATKTTRLLH